MKVRELIQILKKHNPEKDVRFRSGRLLYAITIVRENATFGLVELTNEEQDRKQKTK